MSQSQTRCCETGRIYVTPENKTAITAGVGKVIEIDDADNSISFLNDVTLKNVVIAAGSTLTFSAGSKIQLSDQTSGPMILTTTQGISIGDSQTTVSSLHSAQTVIGANSSSSASSTVVLGPEAESSGLYGISIGYSSLSTNSSSLSVGADSSASGFESTSVGKDSTTTGNYSSAYGSNASATTTGAQAFGRNATASGSSATAIGPNTTASATTSSAFGSGATASGIDSTAIGASTNAGHNRALCLGTGATSTATNQLAIGGSGADALTTQTTVGSAGGASPLPATPTGYLHVNLNGNLRVIPFYDQV